MENLNFLKGAKNGYAYIKNNKIVVFSDGVMVGVECEGLDGIEGKLDYKMLSKLVKKKSTIEKKTNMDQTLLTIDGRFLIVEPAEVDDVELPNTKETFPVEKFMTAYNFTSKVHGSYYLDIYKSYIAWTKDGIQATQGTIAYWNKQYTTNDKLCLDRNFIKFLKKLSKPTYSNEGDHLVIRDGNRFIIVYTSVIQYPNVPGVFDDPPYDQVIEINKSSWESITSSIDKSKGVFYKILISNNDSWVEIEIDGKLQKLPIQAKKVKSNNDLIVVSFEVGLTKQFLKNLMDDTVILNINAKGVFWERPIYVNQDNGNEALIIMPARIDDQDKYVHK